MLHICGVSKTLGEWYQKTNKTEDTNKLTLLAFKIIIILHNTFVCFLVPFTEHFRHTTYMELLVKPEILTSYIYVILWHSCV
jgi:hypothetical protein